MNYVFVSATKAVVVAVMKLKLVWTRPGSLGETVVNCH